MAVSIKSQSEIEKMREAGRLLADLHRELAACLAPGVSTAEIDRRARAFIKECGCTPNFLNYQGYPAAVCVSINEEIVHGIPSKKRKLKDGDLVSLDTGMIYRGYHSDAARSYCIGEGDEATKKLIRTAEECFFESLKVARAGNHLYDISAAIEDCAERNGYSVFHELCGHGIGTSLHEDPQVPNYRQTGKGIRLRAGMTLAIEPMIGAGKRQIRILDDGWTAVTADRSAAAHYENTVLITDGEPEILTLRGSL